MWIGYGGRNKQGYSSLKVGALMATLARAQWCSLPVAAEASFIPRARAGDGPRRSIPAPTAGARQRSAPSATGRPGRRPRRGSRLVERPEIRQPRPLSKNTALCTPLTAFLTEVQAELDRRRVGNFLRSSRQRAMRPAPVAGAEPAPARGRARICFCSSRSRRASSLDRFSAVASAFRAFSASRISAKRLRWWWS